MTAAITSDTARLPIMLTQLRLPTVARLWPTISETADRDGWPAARTLAALLEHEIAERPQRRIARHLLEARLPPGKTLDGFDFAAVSSLSKARLVALAEGDAWLAQGTNILLFGPPGVGKSHLAAALGHALIDAGYRVLFTRTTDLVQQLQAARQELRLAATIEKLDKYHLLVLDDLSYVQKSQAETSVLFELISARYERRSLLITAMQPFGAWNDIFPYPAMTVAAIDRLVHHAIILQDEHRQLPTAVRRGTRHCAPDHPPRQRTPVDARRRLAERPHHLQALIPIDAHRLLDQLAIFRGGDLLDAVAWPCGQVLLDALIDLVAIGKMEACQGQILRDRFLGLKGRVSASKAGLGAGRRIRMMRVADGSDSGVTTAAPHSMPASTVAGGAGPNSAM